MISIHPDMQGHTKAINQSKADRRKTDAALVLLAHKGSRRARGEMVNRYARLAIDAAYSYIASGEPMDDLIAVARIGLNKAIDDFKPERGTLFNSFALWKVRAELTKHCDSSDTIRLPSQARNKAKRELQDQERAHKAGMEFKAVKNARIEAAKTVSIDSPIGEGEKVVTIADTLKADDRTDDVTVTRELRWYVARALSTLPPKYRRVIDLRFGFATETAGEGMTLQEISEIMGLTRERVRQIEDSALGALVPRMAEIRKNFQ